MVQDVRGRRVSGTLPESGVGLDEGMTDGREPSFSAADAALGYLYQVRCALLWALERERHQPGFQVAIETLDDVTFETKGGTPTELLQTKHHRASAAALTNASADLWKTLRVWFEGIAGGSIPESARLCLVTTSVAGDGSAPALLRLDPDSRDVVKARIALDTTAMTSANEANKKAYVAYLHASVVARQSILDRIIVIDAAPHVSDLDRELRAEVHWAAPPDHHDAFLERLEGWWFRRVLKQLSDDGDRVGSTEIQAFMTDLADQFTQDALPIDEDLLDFTLDEATRTAHQSSTFVLQLALAKAGKARIAAAIRNYYRAFTQRSRWLREDLVQGMDLEKYDRRLAEEWEIVFEATRDELGDEATEGAKAASARSVLAWAERENFPIRPRVAEPFVSRGSLQLLSNRTKIGWHPDFIERLGALLKPGTGLE